MESRKRVSYNRKQKEESGMSVIRKWASAATAMAEVCFLLALSVAVAVIGLFIFLKRCFCRS